VALRGKENRPSGPKEVQVGGDYVMPQKKLVLVSGHVVRPVPVVGELKSHVNWAFPGAAHRSTAHSRAAAP
jgi:hypothetical protein